MSATSPRRHRLAVLLAGSVLSLGLLAGCAGQKTPSSYTDGVEEDFMNGCQDIAKQDGVIDSPKDYCQCAWKAIKADVPFKEFKAINSDLTENNGPLPESFTKAFADCKPQG